ncbi:hypothetical protein [Saliterribacillus persicus]|uniref:HNH endonuclease n=1 Tax=Saliterribacillus persicus TaxID=930114 RepID=A0A368XRP5_9BACI|nr:hypothetical protein [Saliterribacillus persicus]RCW70622.1 hypothetical protein DFR57_10619 [Saliterribacillus persicus]
MPHKPKRPCARVGCHNLTEKTYCTDHQINNQDTYNRTYNRYQMDKQMDSFYKSRKWQRLRRLAFERDKGLCQRCLQQGILK